MQDISTMLSRLQNISRYDIRLISVSPSYVKLDQRVSLDPSYNIKKLVQAKFPWIDLNATDFTIGFGVCTNNEPRSMKWNEAVGYNRQKASVGYNRQKARLDSVLEDMGKWIPPS